MSLLSKLKRPLSSPAISVENDEVAVKQSDFIKQVKAAGGATGLPPLPGRDIELLVTEGHIVGHQLNYLFSRKLTVARMCITYAAVSACALAIFTVGVSAGTPISLDVAAYDYAHRNIPVPAPAPAQAQAQAQVSVHDDSELQQQMQADEHAPSYVQAKALEQRLIERAAASSATPAPATPAPAQAQAAKKTGYEGWTTLDEDAAERSDQREFDAAQANLRKEVRAGHLSQDEADNKLNAILSMQQKDKEERMSFMK